MKKTMRLIDPSANLMECKICGKVVVAQIQPRAEQKSDEAGFHYGIWQCPDGYRIK